VFLRILLLAAALVAGGCEGDPAPPPSRAPEPVLQGEEGVLRLLGTGAMAPLARNLATAWMATPEGKRWRVVVEPSVGSGGGARAASDGAVDLGMVSRPLNERERGLGLVVATVARGAVVLAVNRSLPLSGLSGGEVERLYGGEAVASGEGWLTLLLRDREESANAALERWLPSLMPLREQSYRQRKARVLYHDEAMREALAATPGGTGVVDLGAVIDGRGLLKGLAIDGVEPSVAALADGSWKATRELSFVYRPERAARARGFLTFAASSQAFSIYAASGCVPVQRP